MNKKIWIGLVLICLGGLLMVTTFVVDGFPGQIYWNNGPVYLSDADDKGEVDLTPDQITSGKQNVTQLDLSVKDADVTVKTGNRFAISADRAEKNYITVSATDGFVKVTGDERNGWTIGIKNGKRHHITVTLPEKVTLQKVSLANLNGDLQVQKSHVDQLVLVNVNGDITLSEVKVNSAGLVSDRNGDIRVQSSTLPKLKTYSHFGDINVTKNYQNVPAAEATMAFNNLNGDISLT